MTEERALTLQEVAEITGFSYSAIFDKRFAIGFRLPGSRRWRVWPSRLAELTAPRNNVTRLSLRVDGTEPCQSAKIKSPASGKLTSARRAAKELDALLKQATGKPHRNTMIG